MVLSREEVAQICEEQEILLTFADLTNDLTFKMLCGSELNKDFLIHFLNSMLNFIGEDIIIDVQIK